MILSLEQEEDYSISATTWSSDINSLDPRVQAFSFEISEEIY